MEKGEGDVGFGDSRGKRKGNAEGGKASKDRKLEL